MGYPSGMKRLITLILTTVVLGFIGFWLLGVLLKDSLIFHPPPPGYELAPPYQTIEMADGTPIVYRVWENPKTDRVMMYSHGNAEDLSNLNGAMLLYRSLGYTVVAYDYPGYGHSGGTPTVDGATQALLAVIQTVSEDRNLEPNQLTLFGKSIGGGPTIAAASQVPVGGLILESTFTSIFNVPFPYFSLPLDSYPNAKLLASITCPVLIIHGTQDTVIPPHHGTNLYQAANNPKRLLNLTDVGHNNVLMTQNPDYLTLIKKFPQSLTSSP